MQPDFNKLKPVGETPNFAKLKPVTSEPAEEVGGLQSFAQSVAKPFLKIASTVSDIGAQGVSLGADLLGRSDIANKIDATRIKNEGIDYGYFGNVKPMGQTGTFQDVKEAIGVGAEIGSYAIGGGGGAGAVRAGLGGLVKQGVKEGVKTGAASGGLLSFGQSLQEAENSPMDIAYNTIFGTALGAGVGGAFGAATPVAVKAFNKVKSFLNVPSLETKLADGYRKIFNPTARQLKADTRFGNDSFKFLAQEMPDLPVTVNSAGRVEADSAIEMAKLKYSAEASAYKPIIRNSGKYIDIDQTVAKAKAVAKKEFDGTDLIKAEQQIDNEVEAYLRNNPQDINVTENGKRFITLSRADDIKSYSWARGKGWGTPEAEVWNDTNNIIGHALKDAIEKELPSAPIRAMNKRLGQWKNAIDMLERRNAQVSGSGGKLSKYLTKSVGTTIGASLGGNEGGVGGGITGAGTGFLTATMLASAMANPNVRLFVVRQMLNRLSKAGRKDMIQEAEQILKEQASKYLLPAAGKSSYVEQPIALPTSIRETNLGLDEVKNMTQSQPKPLAKIEPTQAPTTQVNKNSNIPNTISQAERNIQSSKDSIARYKEMLADPKSSAEEIDFAERGIEGENNYLKKRGIQGENFKIITEDGIKDVQGKIVKINDELDTFVHEGDNPKRTKKGFIVSEKSSGRFIATGETEREAINNAKNKIEEAGIDKVKQLISNNKGIQEVSGGVAGIELKKDENGKTTVTFNPEKALVGIAGMTAYKKIPAKLRENALDTMSLFKKFKASNFVNSKGKLNLEAFNTVENLFEKAAKGTITREDIKAAEEVHFMLKGNKK